MSEWKHAFGQSAVLALTDWLLDNDDKFAGNDDRRTVLKWLVVTKQIMYKDLWGKSHKVRCQPTPVARY